MLGDVDGAFRAAGAAVADDALDALAVGADGDGLVAPRVFRLVDAGVRQARRGIPHPLGHRYDVLGLVVSAVVVPARSESYLVVGDLALARDTGAGARRGGFAAAALVAATRGGRFTGRRGDRGRLNHRGLRSRRLGRRRRRLDGGSLDNGG